MAKFVFAWQFLAMAPGAAASILYLLGHAPLYSQFYDSWHELMIACAALTIAMTIVGGIVKPKVRLKVVQR